MPILAVQMLAISDENLSEKLVKMKKTMVDEVIAR